MGFFKKNALSNRKHFENANAWWDNQVKVLHEYYNRNGIKNITQMNMNHEWWEAKEAIISMWRIFKWRLRLQKLLRSKRGILEFTSDYTYPKEKDDPDWSISDVYWKLPSPFLGKDRYYFGNTVMTKECFYEGVYDQVSEQMKGFYQAFEHPYQKFHDIIAEKENIQTKEGMTKVLRNWVDELYPEFKDWELRFLNPEEAFPDNK